MHEWQHNQNTSLTSSFTSVTAPIVLQSIFSGSWRSEYVVALKYIQFSWSSDSLSVRFAKHLVVCTNSCEVYNEMKCDHEMSIIHEFIHEDYHIERWLKLILILITPFVTLQLSLTLSTTPIDFINCSMKGHWMTYRLWLLFMCIPTINLKWCYIHKVSCLPDKIGGQFT